MPGNMKEEILSTNDGGIAVFERLLSRRSRWLKWHGIGIVVEGRPVFFAVVRPPQRKTMAMGSVVVGCGLVPHNKPGGLVTCGGLRLCILHVAPMHFQNKNPSEELAVGTVRTSC